MKAHLIRRGKHYAAKFYNPETRKWSHQSLKTTKKALADLRFGQFLEDRHKKELLGELNVEPVPLRILVKEFLEYMEANDNTGKLLAREVAAAHGWDPKKDINKDAYVKAVMKQIAEEEDEYKHLLKELDTESEGG